MHLCVFLSFHLFERVTRVTRALCECWHLNAVETLLRCKIAKVNFPIHLWSYNVLSFIRSNTYMRTLLIVVIVKSNKIGNPSLPNGIASSRNSFQFLNSWWLNRFSIRTLVEIQHHFDQLPLHLHSFRLRLENKTYNKRTYWKTEHKTHNTHMLLYISIRLKTVVYCFTVPLTCVWFSYK